jgi:hypothetical protein
MKRFVWLIVFTVMGCIEPYIPKEIKLAGAILVIDGHIETNAKSTITLTLSQNLLDDAEPGKVLGANVWLENENGVIYNLTEEGNGNYTLLPQAFDNINHRLNIRTPDSKEYISDFVPIKDSPPIDSISWKVNSDLGIDIFANTHDTQNETGYYRWKFDETWKYTSAYNSIFVYDKANHSVELRQNDIFYCYQTKPSTEILLQSTSRLSQSLISEFPLTRIKQTDERLRYTYSILVKQYALTNDAYSYWDQLKKTTENLGTLFGPMPSQVTGNYHCITSPDEKVLGYFSIGATSEQRIFITSLEIPRPNLYDLPYDDCLLFELPLSGVRDFFSDPFLIVGGIPNPNGPGIIGYYYSVIRCADCRVQGGTNVKPDFWP